MTTLDPAALPEEPERPRAERLVRLSAMISRCDPWFRVLGLAWLTPLWRLLAGEDARGQWKDLWRLAVVPAIAILGFLALWAFLAPKVQTSLGAIPGPAQVWDQVGVLHADALAGGE